MIASLFFLLAAGSGEAAHARQISAEKSHKIGTDISAAMRRFEVPGAAVMVLKDGHVEYLAAFGFRDRERRTPVHSGTHFEIGSITKQFTAAAILQLQAKGKLQIDRPLSDYLPKAPHAGEVTLRQLLSHTSGLHDYLDLSADEMERLTSQPIAYDALLARVASLPLDFKPGSRWAYSNTGYLLLGKVIEAVSGEDYLVYLKRNFFRPLHMTATYTTAEEPRLPSAARGYRHNAGVLRRAPVIDATWAGAAGLLVTTLGDLARWDDALQNGRIVSAGAYREMTTAGLTADGGNSGYGLGLFVGSMYGQSRVGHTGGTLGFTTADEYFPRQRTRIIAFTNLGDDAPEAGEALTNIVFSDLYPAVAASAARPAAGENPRLTRVALDAFRELQSGMSYDAFGDRLRTKLNNDVGRAFMARLSPYGVPSAAVFRGTRESADQHWHDYVIEFGPGVSLPFSIRVDDQMNVIGLAVG